LVSLVCRG